MIPVTGIIGNPTVRGAIGPITSPKVVGESASELSKWFETYFPSWLHTLLSGDNVFASVILPGMLISAVCLLWEVLREEVFATVPQRLHDYFLARSGHIERVIEVTESTDWDYKRRNQGGLNPELHTAIKLYIGNRAEKCFETLARVQLLEPDSGKAAGNRRWNRMNVHRSSEDLKRMRIIVAPDPSRVFTIPDTNPPIMLRIDTSSEQGSTMWEQRQKTVFTLTTKHKSLESGRDYLNDFVKKCYQEYRTVMDATKLPGRYLYQLQSSSSDDGSVVIVKSEGKGEGGKEDADPSAADIPPPSMFKKYRLSDDKDFDSLFFPAKMDILRLVDDFRHRTGKFAIEGFPRKLGLLLSGPSGTGKTAFVKALATYLGRHIITLPLEKIKTNQQLYDLMFEEMYACSNTTGSDRNKPEMISNDKVIFLMEVDGAFDLVKSRKASAQPQSASSTPQLKSERMKDLIFSRADALDLAGLLNALDGVVDSPGRVVIMSTSAVSELDAALIRPGRINRIISMPYLTRSCAEEMLVHHFGEEAFSAQRAPFVEEWTRKEQQATDPAQASRTTSYMSPQAIAAARQRSPSQSMSNVHATESSPLGASGSGFPNGSTNVFQMAPAELEQLCIDNDTVEEVVAAFRRYPEVEDLCY